jgi:hypothetical protein
MLKKLTMMNLKTPQTAGRQPIYVINEVSANITPSRGDRAPYYYTDLPAAPATSSPSLFIRDASSKYKRYCLQAVRFASKKGREAGQTHYKMRVSMMLLSGTIISANTSFIADKNLFLLFSLLFGKISGGKGGRFIMRLPLAERWLYSRIID